MLSEIWRFFLLYEQSYGISLALGLFLGTLLPLRFSLPAAFCAWVFGSLFLQAYVVRVYKWVWLKAFYLQPLLDSDLASHEVWTPVLAGPEFKRLAPFVACFALFLLCAAGALLGKVKPSLNPKKLWLLSSALLLAAGGALRPLCRAGIPAYVPYPGAAGCGSAAGGYPGTECLSLPAGWDGAACLQASRWKH